MAVYPVKWFSSEMQGAPSLGDTADGALTALLKAVLVTGFGQLQISSMAWDATENMVKVTIQNGHSYLADSVVDISGASPAVYNGEHRIVKTSPTEFWFYLDLPADTGAASGTIMVKVAPLGWSITHESADGKVFIIRPSSFSESGNVLLRIDNTAFSGWTGTSNAHLAKVTMVEDVIGLNEYTTVFEHRWPATGRYSDKRWDIIGDTQLFYFLPAYGLHNRQTLYLFGYFNSIKPGDRYHAILAHYTQTDANVNPPNWSSAGTAARYSNNLPTFEDNAHRVIARGHNQVVGTKTWFLKGIFPTFGAGLAAQNPPDNGFYLSKDKIMFIEEGGHLRGFLPGLICPFSTISTFNRKNFANIPCLPGQIVRFLLVQQKDNSYGYPVVMMGFDLTGPWR